MCVYALECVHGKHKQARQANGKVLKHRNKDANTPEASGASFEIWETQERCSPSALSTLDIL